MLKKMDKLLLLSSIMLFVIGLIMIFSASNVAGYMQYSRAPYYIFLKQFIFLIVSLIVSVLMLTQSTKTYCKASWPLLLLTIGTLLFVLVYGEITNQAQSWIDFGFMSFQPSEIAKIVTIVWIASLYSISKDKTSYKVLLTLMSIVGLVTVLIVIQPDLGTACIYAFIAFMMFFSLNISSKIKRNVLLTIGLLAAIVAIALTNSGVQLFFERQLSRFDFFNPCSEEKFYTTGNQLCNSFIAINNGNLFGKGLGNSTQKYLYLPEAHTDFIFAIITEELGLLVAIVILIMLFIVLWRIFIIGKKSSTERGRLMCYGIFWYILLHTLINLGGITGLIPLTGVPLPFLSYGGSSLLTLIISLTIVQKVSIETKMNTVD